ncbi:MAG: PTS system mannose/fructose/N-acetylgalactosamine-transporter subunit IIB [Brevefilum sp.]|jgi:mannose/fructose/N-acetylgalactosamine-specific phosphotransferase system component IIB
MIKLIRCDDRLIHGQVIVRVISSFDINKIVIVDDFTASNEVLKSVFALATPPQAKSVVYSIEDAKENMSNFIENNENVLLLMRSPITALELFESIPDLKKEFNIGPMSNRKNSIKITPYAYLTKEEIDAINSLDERGIYVYFNQTIDQKVIKWEELKNQINGV